MVVERARVASELCASTELAQATASEQVSG
jgi:hypothetical protein